MKTADQLTGDLSKMVGLLAMKPGSIADVRIYSTALSSSDISAIYTAGAK